MLTSGADKKIRVLIVEDSAVVRELLRHVISSDNRLEVAEAVSTAEEALRILPRVAPDVVSLDIRLPGMDGLQATRQIMAEHPVPIVVVAASVQSEDLNIAMNALRSGALAVVEKPVGVTAADYERVARHLCTQLRIMSEVHVVRQRSPRAEPLPVTGRALRAALPFVPAPGRGGFGIVGLVASTGGPSALMQVLNGLGADFHLPVVLVQHITPSFHTGFVEWLNGVSPLPVSDARDGDTPQRGRVYVAPAERHLHLEGSFFRLEDAPPLRLQRPSGTLLFRSLARSYGSRCVAALLTGMGDDGADGLLDIRKAGGYTLAEDASTAVVYGMPAAAVELGAACKSVPLGEVASTIRMLVGRGGELS